MSASSDPTTDPALVSWVPVAEGSHFPIQNLPYGVFSRPGGPPRVGVAIGENVLDLAEVAAAGGFAGTVDGAGDLFAGNLDGLLARGRPVWGAVRRHVSRLLTSGDQTLAELGVRERALIDRPSITLHLPFTVGDYVDFYSSIEHATNLGRMFRPDTEPLLPNWRHLPVGYHGRSGTVVVSGTPVRRPTGQRKPPDAPAPETGPSRQLDIELEVGFVTGGGPPLGTPIPAGRAAEVIFGFVLVNDWSARDVQAWEYQPLGPFLGKSFATSLSPWVVPLDALEPYRVHRPEQDPPVQPYLRARADDNLDLQLEVWLRSAAMAAGGTPAHRISATNFRAMYWSMSQQLAHATVNGATVRPGDLFASGTVSGADPGTQGSLIELTWRGTRPLTLPDGSQRAFLEDGDEVTLTGWCGGDGRPRVGFGTCSGLVLPAGG